MSITEKKYSALDYEAVGKRIKQLRGKMQQAEFAEIFGIAQQDISRIELAKVKPSPDLLLKISVHYGKTIDWLVTGEYESPADTISPRNTAAEVTAPYSDPDHLIRKTAKVLRSNSSFCKALDSNIEAFHEAVEMREELDIARAQIADCQHQLDQHKQEMTDMKTHYESVISDLRAKISALEETKSAAKSV